MAKKASPKGSAQKSPTTQKKATPGNEKKTENKATRTKPKVAQAKPEPKLPGWFNKPARDFQIQTKDYAEVVRMHNEFFETQFNENRVPPFQFQIIFEKVKAKLTEKK